MSLNGVFPHLDTVVILQVANNTNYIDSSCNPATLLQVFNYIYYFLTKQTW